MSQKENVFYGKMEIRCGEKLGTGNWRTHDQVTGTLGPIRKVMKSNQRVLRKGKQQTPAGRELQHWWLTACPALSQAGGRTEQHHEQELARPTQEGRVQ